MPCVIQQTLSTHTQFHSRWSTKHHRSSHSVTWEICIEISSERSINQSHRDWFPTGLVAKLDLELCADTFLHLRPLLVAVHIADVLGREVSNYFLRNEQFIRPIPGTANADHRKISAILNEKQLQLKKTV